MNFDVELLGNCDDIVAQLCTALEWPLLDSSVDDDDSSSKTVELRCIAVDELLPDPYEGISLAGDVDNPLSLDDDEQDAGLCVSVVFVR